MAVPVHREPFRHPRTRRLVCGRCGRVEVNRPTECVACLEARGREASASWLVTLDPDVRRAAAKAMGKVCVAMAALGATPPKRWLAMLVPEPRRSRGRPPDRTRPEA